MQYKYARINNKTKTAAFCFQNAHNYISNLFTTFIVYSTCTQLIYTTQLGINIIYKLHIYKKAPHTPRIYKSLRAIRGAQRAQINSYYH